MSNYLKISYKEPTDETKRVDNYEYRNKPFASSPVYYAKFKSFKQLCHGSDVKTVYHVNFTLERESEKALYDYTPGDVIAILPENDDKEVKGLLIRLNIEDICNKECHLEVVDNTKKKNAIVPKHLPPDSTLYNMFLRYIDIRTPPKKLFLKSLLNYTSAALEKELLEKICSPSGSNEYIRLLEQHRSLLALLNAFPSCHPPIELILEYSSPLNPRYYSLTSSPLSNELSFMFYVLELGNGLKGICGGWLERILTTNFEAQKIPLYFRKPGNFRYDNSSIPNILVATGTGLAPFLGFLRHKSILRKTDQVTWLFYGCRYESKDYLCKDELDSYIRDGTLTKLFTAFSRDGVTKEYVQHKILERKTDIANIILKKDGIIYVCGDTKTVAKDLKECFIQCLMEYDGDRQGAEELVNKMINDGRYLVDSWI